MCVETYDDRDDSLDLLGFETYDDYLRSDLWRVVRREIARRDDFLCQICGEPYEVVHHMSYSVQTLTGEHNENLVALCAKCHRRVEFGLDGKRTLEDSVQATRAILRRSVDRNPALFHRILQRLQREYPETYLLVRRF